jgi:hypothetical protein
LTVALNRACTPGHLSSQLRKEQAQTVILTIPVCRQLVEARVLHCMHVRTCA